MRGNNAKCYTAANIKRYPGGDSRAFLLIVYVKRMCLAPATGATSLSFQSIVDDVQTVRLDVLWHALKVGHLPRAAVKTFNAPIRELPVKESGSAGSWFGVRISAARYAVCSRVLRDIRAPPEFYQLRRDALGSGVVVSDVAPVLHEASRVGCVAESGALLL